MKKKVNKKISCTGFSLVEVLISMALATLTLLGLAAGQVKSLQFANNSFDYTLSLIQAQNASERIWVDLCNIQQSNIVYDANYISNIGSQFSSYDMTLPANFSNNFIIRVDWTDDRMTDGLNSTIQLNAAYPQLPAGASC